VNFTNVTSGWTIDGVMLKEELGIPKIKLINDFEAQGYGLLTLRDSEKKKLNDAVPRAGAPIACVGAGTGLGECFLTADSRGVYTCFPSEGGHAEFAPRSPLTHDLRDQLVHLYDTPNLEMLGGSRPKRVSVERVVSGPGLANIYRFLRSHWAYVDHVGQKIDQDFVQAPKHMMGAVVARGAREADYVCQKAVDVFSECYGSEAGVVALKFLPFGGLYVSGGIAAKNPEWIESKTFYDAYKDKGRLSPTVEQVPLYLVLTEDTGERGALYAAISMLLDH
jgi:glucokinase